MSDRYIMDTGILLGYLRGAPYAESLESEFHLSQSLFVVSIVSIGELYAIALRQCWSKDRMDRLADIISAIPPIDISNPNIVEKYGEIAVYSQGRHPTKKLPKGTSSRQMSNNDTWIAATGTVLKATLLTTDGDFDHLDGVFLDVVHIDQKVK
jgi:tRNA(fMet)-specific endonuclease VapC